METIVRALAIYVFLQILIRVSGRRTLGEMTSFDLVLLLIVSEATQQALLGNDFSVTNAFIVIATLIGFDIFLSYLKKVSPSLDRWIDGMPTLLMVDGRKLEKKIKACRLDDEDILEAARKSHGIGTFAQIRHAVLERNGDISIIPR